MNQPIRKSRSRAAAFGVLAVIVASATAYAVWSFVSQYEQRLAEVQAAKGESVVVVATKSIRPGTVLGPEDIELQSRPVGDSDESYFRDVDSVLGMTVGDRILAGEAIRLERMLAGGAAMGLDELIDPGARAITLRTSRASGVGGLVRPGNYVDVIVTIRPDDRALNADWVTETVLQAVQVVAVNDVTEAQQVSKENTDDRGKKTKPAREVFVTLEVEPAEAEQLALATTRGEVHLSLRSVDDFDFIENEGPLVTNALLGLPEQVKKAQQRRLTRKTATMSKADVAHTTEVIRGSDVSIEQFDSSGDRINTPSKRRR
jgi:pilus assembly protein CpaB